MKPIKLLRISLFVLILCAGMVRDARAGLPESLKGFSGMVHGKIISKGEGHIMLQVTKVIRVWKNNKASNPDALKGKTVKVGPRWVKGEDGKWRRVESHVAFLNSLEVGQFLVLEIGHAKRDVFSVLELSEKQRELVKRNQQLEVGAGGEREKEREKDRDKERPEASHEIEKKKKEIKHEIEDLYKRIHELKRELEMLEKTQQAHGEKGEKEGEKRSHVEARKGTEGRIIVGEPQYRKKHHTLWQGKGRIVGRITNPDVFMAVVINSKGHRAKKFRGSRETEEYELEWFVPGKYTLVIHSKKYGTCKITDLEVKEYHDLILDIVFSAAPKEEKKEEHRPEKEEKKEKNHIKEVELF